MEAAGIEPSRDSSVTGEAPSDCINGQHPRAAHALQFLRANQHESASNDTHCQSVHLPPAVIRIAESWADLPPHIREAIQTLVDVATAGHRTSDPSPSSERKSVGRDKVAWRLAQECRSIVQVCLREEEWQDADREFFGVISNGLASL
jgi:hypothetical protein